MNIDHMYTIYIIVYIDVFGCPFYCMLVTQHMTTA